MAAPTNTTLATAMDIGTTLPYSTTQTVDDAGTTYTVWYAYTAQPDDVVIGVLGFGDVVRYAPVVSVWTSVSDTWLPTLQITGDNVAIQLPVVVGTTYYFEFTPNAGNPTPAVLHLSIERSAQASVPAGSIAVPDDSAGFPLALIDATSDFNVLAFRSPFAASEAGDVLAESGAVLAFDDTDNALKIYSADYATVLATLDSTWLTAGD